MSDRWKMREYLLSKQDKCKICGNKKSLEMHHLKGQSSHPELKYDLNNIMILCTDCHDVVHGNHVEIKAKGILKRVMNNLKE
jgi:5-methylcytosine-specific restriction endonuclease McrA